MVKTKNTIFEYMGKRYTWVNEDQGIIDCTCDGCQRWLRIYIKNGILVEVKKEIEFTSCKIVEHAKELKKGCGKRYRVGNGFNYECGNTTVTAGKIKNICYCDVCGNMTAAKKECWTSELKFLESIPEDMYQCHMSGQHDFGCGSPGYSNARAGCSEYTEKVWNRVKELKEALKILKCQ